MGMSSCFSIKFSEVSRTPWLSLSVPTANFTKNTLPSVLDKYSKHGFEPLGSYVTELGSGEYIKQEEYSLAETDYIYVSVNNFSQGEIDLVDCVFLDEGTGRQYEHIRLHEGDLIITRSGTVGRVALFTVPDGFNDKIFIPSHHLAILRTKEPQNDIVLKHYLNTPFCRQYFEAFSTGKSQKELTNWSIRKVPVPLALNKDRLREEFSRIDEEMATLRRQVNSLQHIIDNVFCSYGLKKPYEQKNPDSISFLTPLHSIGRSKELRLGANYNAFWHKHKGYLFEPPEKDGAGYPIVPLRRLLGIAPRTTVKKGSLPEARILIDFEQVQARTGRIVGFENWVDELGSSRIEFGECDLLTNKLRPYLGYTILNEPEKALIGTPEFVPLSVLDKEIVLREYIRYILLSYEYLEKSKLLMSGKQHPRLQPLDILSLRVPLPDIRVQEQIISRITELEKESERYIVRIAELQQEVLQIIDAELAEEDNRIAG